MKDWVEGKIFLWGPHKFDNADGYSLVANKQLEKPGHYIGSGIDLTGKEDVFEVVDLINDALDEIQTYEED